MYSALTCANDRPGVFLENTARTMSKADSQSQPLDRCQRVSANYKQIVNKTIISKKWPDAPSLTQTIVVQMVY